MSEVEVKVGLGTSWTNFMEAANRSFPQDEETQGRQIPPCTYGNFHVGWIVRDPSKPLGASHEVRVTFDAQPNDIVPTDCVVQAIAITPANGQGSRPLQQQSDFSGPDGHLGHLHNLENWEIEPISGDKTPDAAFVSQTDGSTAIRVSDTPDHRVVSLRINIGEHTHDPLGTPIAISPSNPHPGNELWSDTIGEYALDGALGIGLLCTLAAGAWRHFSVRRQRTQRAIARETARTQSDLILNGELDTDVIPLMTVEAQRLTRQMLRKKGWREEVIDGDLRQSRWFPPKQPKGDSVQQPPRVAESTVNRRRGMEQVHELPDNLIIAMQLSEADRIEDRLKKKAKKIKEDIPDPKIVRLEARHDITLDTLRSRVRSRNLGYVSHPLPKKMRIIPRSRKS